MKLSVAKSTLAVLATAALVGVAGVADAQVLRITHSYSDAQGVPSAAATNFITAYGARIEGAAPFEVRSVSFRVYFNALANIPNSFDVAPGRTTSTFIKTFNAAPDGAGGGSDLNENTDRFGIGNPTFTSDGGFPLATNANTVPASWAPGQPGNGAFEPLLIIGFPSPVDPGNFGLTGNPPTASGVVVREPGSTVTGAFVSNANTIGLSNREGDFVLAVEMVDLDAKATNTGVLVTWETGMEIDNAGFNVYSQSLSATSPSKLNPILIGAAGTAASYSYMDSRLLGNGESRAYYVEDVDVSGLATTLHGPVVVTGGVSQDDSNVEGWDLY